MIRESACEEDQRQRLPDTRHAEGLEPSFLFFELLWLPVRGYRGTVR
jgi:hypothetical protein